MTKQQLAGGFNLAGRHFLSPLQLKAETLAPDGNFCPLYQFEKHPTLCELESLLMKFSKKMCTSDHDDGYNVGGGDIVAVMIA